LELFKFSLNILEGVFRGEMFQFDLRDGYSIKQLSQRDENLWANHFKILFDLLTDASPALLY